MELYPNDRNCEDFSEEMIHFFKVVNKMNEEEKIEMLSALKCFEIIYKNKNKILFFPMWK